MNYERLAANMQKRFAESVARYEGDIAILQESRMTEIEALQAEIASLKETLSQAEGALVELAPAKVEESGK